MRLPFAVRRSVAALLRNVPVRIQSGPNRGVRWSLASAGRGARAGTFEAQRVEALTHLVRPGDDVWDLGAHKGYVGMALSRAVGPEGSVTSVEPSQQNLWFLRKHIAWNRPGNITVIEAAVAERDGSDAFGGHGSTIQFHLGEGDETVHVMCLPTLLAEGGPRPHLIKMDIEGSEAGAIRAAADVLSRNTVLFVSLHSREQYQECRVELEAREFRLFESHPLRALVRDPGAPWREDPELLAVGAERDISDDDILSLPLFAPEAQTQ
jgi:FkbM family methyltransferase